MNAYKSYKRRNKKLASAPEPAVLSERPKNENGEDVNFVPSVFSSNLIEKENEK